MTSSSDKPEKPSAELVRLRPKRPCPLCQKPSQHKYHPFCSARCADIDLHRWLGGQYAVPAVEPPDFEDADMARHANENRNED